MVDDIVEDLRRTATDYDEGATRLIESCLLHVATVLGDLMRDSIVVVGGLVPGLLIPRGTLPPGAAAHPGTTDLDLGLRLALLVEERYRDALGPVRAASFLAHDPDDALRADVAAFVGDFLEAVAVVEE